LGKLELANATKHLLVKTVGLTSLAAFTFLLLAFLLVCFRRSLSSQTVGRWMAIVIASAGVGSLTWSATVFYGEQISQPILATGTVCSVSILFAGMGGAMLGYLTFLLTGRIIAVPSGWLAPVLQQTLFLIGVRGSDRESNTKRKKSPLFCPVQDV